MSKVTPEVMHKYAKIEDITTILVASMHIAMMQHALAGAEDNDEGRCLKHVIEVGRITGNKLAESLGTIRTIERYARAIDSIEDGAGDIDTVGMLKDIIGNFVSGPYVKDMRRFLALRALQSAGVPADVCEAIVSESIVSEAEDKVDKPVRCADCCLKNECINAH